MWIKWSSGLIPKTLLNPLRFPWVFSQRIKHQHLKFSVAVRLSLAHILKEVHWWAVSIITIYEVISSRWSRHFWVKIHVFSISLNNNSKSCSHNREKCLSMCYFSCKAQKNYHFSRLADFQFLVKSKMATTVGCVTGLQQSYHPWNIPYLVKKIKGFRLKAKSFRNTATQGVPSTPHPPLYHNYFHDKYNFYNVCTYFQMCTPIHASTLCVAPMVSSAPV